MINMFSSIIYGIKFRRKIMLILERFIDGFAIVEGPDGSFRVPIKHIDGAKEGDVLICENGRFKPDKEASSKRADMIKARLSKIAKRDE